MATILARVPLDEINDRARKVSFGRALLTLAAALLYAVGWLAAKAFGAVWLVLAWSAVAVKVGWVEARAGARSGGARGSS